MSKHSPINDRIKLQASTWVSRLNRGLTDDEKPQLIAWINQDPAHHRAVYNVATFFDNIEQLKELNGVFPIEKSQQQQARKKATFFCLMMLTIVSVLWSMHWYVNSSNRANTPQIYASDLGKREQITLSDGSIVTLNSASMIKVSYRRDHRLVNLLKGEAQFDVESDPTRPFTVTVGTQSFTALGTIFNVQKNNESDMELLVTEGQVLVTNAALEQRALIDLITVEKAKFMSTRIITSGEEAIIENSQQRTTRRLNQQQIKQTLAWRQGILVFQGESLVEALEEVSRYTDVQFELTDDSLTQLSVAGTFQAGDIKGLLNSLRDNFDIKYHYTGTNSVQLGL